MEKALSSRHRDAGGTSTTYKPGCIVFMQPISLVQYMGKQVLPQRFHIYISILPMSSHKLLGNFPAADPNLLDNVLPSLWWEPVHHIKAVMCSHSILYLLSHTHTLSLSLALSHTPSTALSHNGPAGVFISVVRRRRTTSLRRRVLSTGDDDSRTSAVCMCVRTCYCMLQYSSTSGVHICIS